MTFVLLKWVFRLRTKFYLHGERSSDVHAEDDDDISVSRKLSEELNDYEHFRIILVRFREQYFVFQIRRH